MTRARLSLTAAILSVVAFLLVSPAHAAPSFTTENALRIASATPQVIVGDYATLVRMYFVRDYKVFSASSTDGITWLEDPGIRISSEIVGAPALDFSSVTAASLLPLNSGGFRMVIAVSSGTAGFRILTATSSDGLAWGMESGVALVFNSGNTFIGSPRLIELSGGNWRLYFTRDVDGGNDLDDRQIYTALSTDEGFSWASVALVVDERADEIAVSTLSNSRVRLYYAAPLTGDTTTTQVLSAISSDSSGTTFSTEGSVRFSTPAAVGEISSLTVFRTTETYAWRLYYGFRIITSTHVHIFTAVAETPNPQDMSPGTVTFADVAQTFTITGEIFSGSPTVELLQTGQPTITGTSVSRTSDQTITAVFDTQNQNVGAWDLRVTNADGLVATLSGAVIIEVPRGTIVMLDNVMRPRLNQQTSITATIFVEGTLKMKLYTMDGQFLKTLVNETRAIGSHTITWDGTVEDGSPVASGTYLVLIEGPRLESKQKIVVIR